MSFLVPAVWWLALAIAVPVAIHLLERDRSRHLTFPSLRFLQPTRLAAVRRRRLQDLPLLALRVAIVLAAVMALAGPVVITPGREAAWARRVARAVVLDAAAAAPEDELRGAASGATFARARLDDAIRDAVRWLDDQALSAKELVVLSSFRRGALAAADLAVVPADVGIRLVRTSGATETRERETVRLQWREDGLVRVTERLTLTATTSRLDEVGVSAVRDTPIAVTASAADQEEADVALHAVLRRGVRLPPAGLMQRLEVEWPGSVERLAAVIDERLAARLEAWEPERMDDDVLAAWSRPMTPSGRPQPEDMGDRRLVWAVVLGLLAAETWIRKGAA